MKIRFARTARSSPETIGGLNVPYAPAKRAAPQWRWYAILACVASPALLLVLGMIGSSMVRGAQGSIAVDQLEVRSQAAGRVTAVNVTPGDRVSAAALLVTTAPELQHGRVRELPAPSRQLRPSDIAAAALRRRTLELARERRDGIAMLVERGAATQPELREAEIAHTQALEAWLEFSRASVGVRPASATLDADTAGHASVGNAAPFAAQVLDVFVTPGEIVRAGDPLVLLGRDTEPKVVAYVPPQFATNLSVAMPATIMFPDGTRATARVAQPARVTRRMPADMVDDFGQRPMMVVLTLTAADAWPQQQKIHGMPVRIRFHYGWESTASLAFLSPVLDSLTGAP
jgi:multidrug resistance efflux pump